MELIQQEELIARRARGESIRKIAEQMSLSTATVFKWVRRLKVEVTTALAIERDALYSNLEGKAIEQAEVYLLSIINDFTR
jgi:transposase